MRGYFPVEGYNNRGSVSSPRKGVFLGYVRKVDREDLPNRASRYLGWPHRGGGARYWQGFHRLEQAGFVLHFKKRTRLHCSVKKQLVETLGTGAASGRRKPGAVRHNAGGEKSDKNQVGAQVEQLTEQRGTQLNERQAVARSKVAGPHRKITRRPMFVKNGTMGNKASCESTGGEIITAGLTQKQPGPKKTGGNSANPSPVWGEKNRPCKKRADAFWAAM